MVALTILWYSAFALFIQGVTGTCSTAGIDRGVITGCTVDMANTIPVGTTECILTCTHDASTVMFTCDSTDTFAPVDPNAACPGFCTVPTVAGLTYGTGTGCTTACSAGDTVAFDTACCPMCLATEAASPPQITCQSADSMFSDETPACTACSDITNCEACTDTDGDGTVTCTDCAAGFVPDATGATCADCPSVTYTNCDECTRAGAEVTCSSCATGMVPNAADDACEACTAAATDGNCNQCVDNACTDCQSGYVLNESGVCTACTAAVDNEECSACVANVCTACNSGFDLTLTDDEFDCVEDDDDDSAGTASSSFLVLLSAVLMCLLAVY